MAGKHSLRLSKSSVGMYLQCPKSYWFSKKLTSKTDYPRLMGTEIHKFIAKMHSSNKNPLYFKSINSARKAWFWTWRTALEENNEKMVSRSKEMDDDYGKAGWFCVYNYWRQNLNKPTPFMVEKRYEHPLFPRVNFVGIFDQIRKMDIEKIAEIRPEIVKDGKLEEGYAPVVIVDCKTGKGSYDPRRYNPEITPIQLAAHQFELHEDLQVTAYYWLYYQIHKKIPVAFYWYHLRDGKAFMTYRTKKDFNTFLEIMNHVVDGIKAESYPKHPGNHCKRCDYFKECAELREDRPLMAVEPTDGIDTGGKNHFWPKIQVSGPEQLRFNFRPPRTPRKLTKK